MILRTLSILLATTVLTVAPGPAPAADADAGWTLAGGVVTWRIHEDTFRGLGITLEREPAERARSRPGGTLTVRDSKGVFAGFDAGGLLFTDGPILRHDGGTLDLSSFRIVSAGSGGRDLAIVDLSGTRWFDLVMGQHWFEDGQAILRANFMELRPSAALAKALGNPAIEAAYLGELSLVADVLESEAFLGRPKRICREPRWPDPPENNFIADILMLEPPARTSRAKSGAVAETYIDEGRDRGLVYMTPAAVFRVAGNADIPWYFRYVTPETDPEGDCLDDGNGQCLPYGESQGGYLTWNIYRLGDDGLLEQVGRSGVKHAFNSVNERSSVPEQTCACLGSSRIAFEGCEDIYSITTNENRRFLGPRSEIDAFDVNWNSCGSVFDRDCDGQCDIPNVNEQSPQSIFPCLADVDDGSVFQAGVPEAVMNSEDRLFLETWYLTRDDVDVLNSMGSMELVRDFADDGGDGVWLFDTLGDFATGTIVQRVAAEAGRTPEVIDTGAGLVIVDAHATDLGDGWTRFVYTIMNVDFDPEVGSLTVPTPPGLPVRNAVYLDGDADASNDWSMKQTEDTLIWKAPSGSELDWGTMATLGFEAPRSACSDRVSLGIGGQVEKSELERTAPRPVADAAFIHGSSFEAQLPACEPVLAGFEAQVSGARK